MARLRSTTILAVRHNGGVALAGDGQVTLGDVRHEGRRPPRSAGSTTAVC